ncbi:ATP-binding cassette domain-containing protein [Maritimibacter sp. DP1N21-5]|uniref:thiamine ABC transporter ATP-binding protein n=1 Tax=Maritimibacter sp. DP1N21-5 TaxID=2836867 RepID=UPI001C48C728|nr:ATP-binding cassette domain-containing protein [Maritimibacter sp. DP1N21-5]MBV7410917.1 ATP-binding cassette domain-containing protein [Maritimibacter sp. DP1N21-5]
MLTLDHVTVINGDFTLTADMQVAKGHKVAILGPSGSGKSTLLAGIAGFLDVTGQMSWDGRDLAPLAPADRPVSMIFQDNNLFPHLTAAQNVGLGLRPDLRLGRANRERVEEALAHVGLHGLGPRKPAQLSGGQVARVALARALLRDKPLMLLDEPFGALGPALRAEMLDLVARLAEETSATLLMVSHEPEDARRIADDIILVSEGHADAPVPVADIFANPPEALRNYLGR